MVLVRTASPKLTSTHDLCFEEKYENIRVFFKSEIFQFLEVKLSIYLNRLVFVMSFVLESILDLHMCDQGIVLFLVARILRYCNLIRFYPNACMPGTNKTM